jgi:alpha-galactosidase
LRSLRPILAAAATTALVATGLVAIETTVIAPPALALENGLARTPPMGFNNWNTTACRAEFNENMIKAIADLFVSRGLRDAGYQYVNIDDCWARPTRNAQGNLVADPARFPSGMKALGDYIHARGLKFGIYTSAGTKTCNTAGFPGALNNEQRDANLFASFGVDYLKYDNCNNQGVDARTRYTRMRDALANTGRPIVYSICEWGQNQPWTWAQPVGNLWRTTGDISDRWDRMLSIFKRNVTLAQHAAPGAWNDADMLEVGNGGMTTTEYRSHFGLWAIMASPLLIGSDLREVGQTDMNILLNRDIVAVNQDPLGRQATIVSSTGGRWILTKVMADGSRAVALFNETGSTQTINTTASAIGLPGGSSYELFDLYSKARRTTSGAISASVPVHGIVMYRVTRAGGTGDRHEAEDATISQGAVESQHAGFSGTGYVNTVNTAGPYVQWSVNATAAGSVTLRFRHANGTTVNRPLNISVNGAPPTAVNFPGTGAWTSYATVTVPATLNAGANTIRATATTADGAPNLDYLEVATG